MRIVLHLGAHKTATTYIQETLSANRLALQEYKVGYVRLEEMREHVTPCILQSPRLKEALQCQIAKHRNCSTLILSDENLVGAPYELLRNSTPYPNLEVHVDRLLKALSDHEVVIMFSTRSYASFLSSMYCEHLRHSPFVTAKEYLRQASLGAISWRKVARDLCKLAGAERVAMWRYEDFRQVEDAVFAAILGNGVELKKPGRDVRESLSHKAVAALTSLRPRLNRQEVRRLIGCFAQALPKSDDYPAFSAFSEVAGAKLEARYQQDLQGIAADWPLLNFLPTSLKEQPSTI